MCPREKQKNYKEANTYFNSYDFMAIFNTTQNDKTTASNFPTTHSLFLSPISLKNHCIKHSKSMAFLLCNLNISLFPQSKSRIRDKPFHQTLSSSKPISQCSLFFTSSSPSLQTSTARVAQVNTPLATQDKQNQHQKDDFYLNLGLAVRTLREDMPLIFVKDLNYDIYR